MKKWKAGILFLLLTLILCVPASAEAATQAQKENCKQIILDMLYSADTGTRNISQYRMTTTELDELCAEIRYGDGAEIFGGYFPSAKFTYTYALFGGYVKTIRLTNVNGDALTRYEQMVPVIDSIIAGIEDDMTDLDKLLYLHDVVVETVAYKKTTDAMYIASGALVDKQAVCAGYAKALNVLLHRVGLETSYVSGTSLDHGWSYVKLDGQWYHVDPTWDDTRTPVSGKTSRTNLLRNDAEFGKNHGVWEVRVIDETSESTLYENWVVHDIVGEMRFEDGLWYYLDPESKTVVAVDAVNNCKEELFSYYYLGSVTLVDIIDDRMILNVNGREESRTVEEWKIAAEEAEKMAGGESGFPMDFSDIAYWRTGHYNPSTGTYGANKNRICLNDVLENVQEQYTITISEENYKIAIRELNERKKLIASVEVGDGEVYIPSEGTCYFGISIFNGVLEKGIIFADYEEMFAKGFTVGLNLRAEENKSEDFVEETEPEYDDVESSEKNEPEEVLPELEAPEMNIPEDLEAVVPGIPETEDTGGVVPEDAVTEEPEEGVVEELKPAYSLDLTDLSNWRTGHFNPNTGTYGLNSNRICLNDYMENLHKKYMITISNPDYRIIVREYNERKRLVSSGDVGNGEVYIPAEDTCYLSFSVYNCVQEKGIRFTHYETLFAEGFEIGIYTVE